MSQHLIGKLLEIHFESIQKKEEIKMSVLAIVFIEMRFNQNIGEICFRFFFFSQSFQANDNSNDKIHLQK